MQTQQHKSISNYLSLLLAVPVIFPFFITAYFVLGHDL